MWCWRQSVSTDHPVHSQPPAGSADLQPASTPSAPQCPLQTWGKKNGLWQQNIKQQVHHTLFGDEHVGTTNWERIRWTKHGWCRTLLLTWVQLVGPEFQAGALGRGQVRAQQVSPLHGCRPVAAWKEQEVTLRKRQGSLFYILLHIRDETRSYQWYLCLKMIKKCSSPCDCQCTDIFDEKWNTWLAWEHVAFSTISTAEGAQALIVSIGLTPLCAQSVVVRRGGEVPLRLLIGQLPVQLVLFETFLSVLSVSPATQPSLQCALWTWGVRDKHKEDKTVCCCLDV